MAMITMRTGGTYVGPPYRYVELALTAGISDVMFCPWGRDLFIQVDLSGLGSADEVDITVEGSLDGVGYDNLDAADVVTTIDTNGTTLLKFEGAIPPYTRVRAATTEAVAGSATISIIGHIQTIS